MYSFPQYFYCIKIRKRRFARRSMLRICDKTRNFSSCYYGNTFQPLCQAVSFFSVRFIGHPYRRNGFFPFPRTAPHTRALVLLRFCAEILRVLGRAQRRTVLFRIISPNFTKLRLVLYGRKVVKLILCERRTRSAPPFRVSFSSLLLRFGSWCARRLRARPPAAPCSALLRAGSRPRSRRAARRLPLLLCPALCAAVALLPKDAALRAPLWALVGASPHSPSFIARR